MLPSTMATPARWGSRPGQDRVFTNNRDASSIAQEPPVFQHRDADDNLNEAPRAGSTSERSDTYRNVVVRVNARWRVIVCKNDRQWILQLSKAEGGPALAWRGLKYFRTRKALIAACAHLCGSFDPSALAALAALPENFRSAA